MWSTAGNGSIHAYRDGRDVEGVAVAPNISRIDDITSSVIKSANFSSRVRQPKQGQVVIWRNTSQYLAATAIRRVTLTDEGRPGTELLADYRVLADREADFASTSGRRSAEVLQAATEARTALYRATSEVISATDAGRVIGIGHNQPPSDVSPDNVSVEEVEASISTAEVLVTGITAAPNPQESIDTINSTTQKVRDWAARRLEEIGSAAAKVLGTAGGAFIVMKIAEWSAVAIQLGNLVNALRTFFQAMI